MFMIRKYRLISRLKRKMAEILHKNKIIKIQRAGGVIDCGAVSFKTENEFEEFYSGELDPLIQLALFSISGFVKQYQASDTVITEVYRTKLERQRLYPIGHHLYSVVGAHERWEALDIRTWNLKWWALEAVLKFYENYLKPLGIIIKYHKIPNNGYHFHIQKVKRS